MGSRWSPIAARPVGRSSRSASGCRGESMPSIDLGIVGLRTVSGSAPGGNVENEHRHRGMRQGESKPESGIMYS